MARLARDVMTPEPACCAPETTLDEVAKLMLSKDCGAIPIVDRTDHGVGVVTDRDIVCRIVAKGENPMAHTAAEAMSQPVVTVRASDSVHDVWRRWRNIRFDGRRFSTNAAAAPASSRRPMSRAANRSMR